MAPCHELTARRTALSHLHQRGVMHCDLYAHNILIDPVHGQARLGDFGAATRLPAQPSDVGRGLLALEVRALGCLLEELGAATSSGTADTPPAAHKHRHAQAADPALQAMLGLAAACLSERPAERPGVAEVAQALQALKLDRC
jgi:serine/threonine protein kinase